MQTNKNINLAKFEKTKNFTPATSTISKDIQNDFLTNFSVFLKQIFKYTIKSKTFWILAVGFPMFVMLNDLIFLGLFNSPDVAIELQGNLMMNIAMWIFIVPMLTIGMMILPGFIISLRESNLLKTMRMIGVNKIQFYIFYVAFVVMFLTFVIFILIGPIYSLESLIANAAVGDQVEQYSIFKNIQISTFIIVVIFGIFLIATSGYWLGMKGKTSRAIFYFGFGILIFTFFTQSFNLLFTSDLFKNYGELEHHSFGSLLGLSILVIGKYLYLLTPFTILSTSIHISSNFNDFIDKANVLYYFTISLSLTLSIIITVYVTFKYNDIGNYEAGR